MNKGKFTYSFIFFIGCLLLVISSFWILGVKGIMFALGLYIIITLTQEVLYTK